MQTVQQLQSEFEFLKRRKEKLLKKERSLKGELNEVDKEIEKMERKIQGRVNQN